MKHNDNFDDKLREKLHDFEPDFEERAWRNFAPNLQQASQVNRFARYKKYVAYAASVTVFLTAAAYMGYQNYRLVDTNKALKEKNTAYQNLIEKEKINQQSKEVQTFDPQKTDKNGNNVPSTAQNTESTTPLQKDKEIGNAQEAQANLLEKEANMESNKAIKSQENKLANQTKSKAYLKEKAILKENKAPKEPESELVNVVITFKNRPNDSVSIPKTPESELVNTNNNSKENNLPSITPSQEKKTDLEIREIQNRAENIPAFAYSPKISLQKPLDFPITKPKMGIYVGAIGVVSKGMVGTGGMVSLAFLPKWSANVGIEFGKQTGERFEDEDDFEEQTGEEFNQILPIPASNNTSFSEISYSRTMVSLPVSVQYQQKIMSHFSFVASAGTRVLLDAKQHFSYRYKKPNSGGGEESHEDNFQHRPPMGSRIQRFPMMLGLGVQANVQRWQFQAVPYYMARLDDDRFPKNSPLDKVSPFSLELRIMRRF